MSELVLVRGCILGGGGGGGGVFHHERHGNTSPHKPRLVVSHSTCPPLFSSLTHTIRMDCFSHHNADQLGSLAGLSFPAVHVGVVECAPASIPPASYSLTHTHRMHCFCNHNPDKLGSLVGLSFPAVYVGVAECTIASLVPASSSLTHTRRIDGFCNQKPDQLGSLSGLSFPDGQTSPHMPRLVVPHITCPSLSPSPPRTQLYNRSSSNKHTPRLQLCNRNCSNKQQQSGKRWKPNFDHPLGVLSSRRTTPSWRPPPPQKQTVTHTPHIPGSFGWRIHCGGDVTELSNKKQHTLSVLTPRRGVRGVSGCCGGLGHG